MSDSIAAGCGEMVSNDSTMDGELISIDPDIRNREWGPILRNPAITPPPLLSLPPSESLVETSQLLSGGLSGGLETRLRDHVEFRSYQRSPSWKMWTKSPIIILANTHKLDVFR
jgi:hypothetical protein